MTGSMATGRSIGFVLRDTPSKERFSLSRITRMYEQAPAPQPPLAWKRDPALTGGVFYFPDAGTNDRREVFHPKGAPACRTKFPASTARAQQAFPPKSNPLAENPATGCFFVSRVGVTPGNVSRFCNSSSLKSRLDAEALLRELGARGAPLCAKSRATSTRQAPKCAKRRHRERAGVREMMEAGPWN
jgi:hypothetical protein